MKRRHHNNHGSRQARNGRLERDAARIARRMRIRQAREREAFESNPETFCRVPGERKP